jgi:hypothetical protein
MAELCACDRRRVDDIFESAGIGRPPDKRVSARASPLTTMRQDDRPMFETTMAPLAALIHDGPLGLLYLLIDGIVNYCVFWLPPALVGLVAAWAVRRWKKVSFTTEDDGVFIGTMFACLAIWWVALSIW